jgi:hypothetical protein
VRSAAAGLLGPARLRRAQERANGDNLGQAVARASPHQSVGVGPSQRRRNNENRKHAFGCVLSGTFGRYVDITRLGAVPRVGGGRCTMSGSGRESISDRRRILGYEERSRTCVPGLPSRPWLSSLVPERRSERPRAVTAWLPAHPPSRGSWWAFRNARRIGGPRSCGRGRSVFRPLCPSSSDEK